ncbi:MAG: hypothetical protein QOE84_2255, partial [Actinomycetota bacterium]|nr:hypothetical protein [Actinomycetota bacterium]
MTDLLIPPPETVNVTGVDTDGGLVNTSTPAAIAPAEIRAVGDMNATAGLLLVNVKVVSVGCTAAMATRANAPCDPVVCVTSIVQSDGGTAGSRVSWLVTEMPFHVAVIVTGVVTATWLVWIENGWKKLPVGAVTVAGTTASGELLDRLMTAPLGPAL